MEGDIMKWRTTGLIAVLSLVFAAIPSIQTHAAVADWQQGVSIQPASETDFASSSFQQSIDNVAATGANHITLIIPVYQSNIYATDIMPGENTPTEQSLASAARYIKAKGMNVSFAVHANSRDGQWRATINPGNPGDRASWFNNYGIILNRYATIAQNVGVSQYVLGTELSDMTDPNVNASNTSAWKNLIQDVRARYSGKLTYSAQHSYYKSDLMSLGFWPQLDVIGISAYYGLGAEATPSLENVKANWNRWNNEQIRTISERYSKPVIFTEVGYVSRDYGLRDPGSGFGLNTAYNAQAQATGYRALFEYWNPYPYMQGVSLWDWKSNPNAGGEGDGDYTPQNKPAQEVMRQWFTGGATVPVSSPTPVTSPPPVAVPTQPVPTEPASYSAIVQATPRPTVNNQVTISAAVTASRPVSGVIVDIEVYSAAGERVAQQFFENESLSSSAKTYTMRFTPNVASGYTIKTGIFSSSWQSNLYWNGDALSFSAESSAPPAPVTSQQPAPIQPTPALPAPPQTNPAQPIPGTVSVWWPGDSVAVSGVQPFKAVLDGRDTSQYKMYWQVDGGAMNLMGEGAGSPMHKLSYVDLSSWKWNPSKQYAIRFLAHDQSGNIIGEKTVIITVS